MPCAATATGSVTFPDRARRESTAGAAVPWRLSQRGLALEQELLAHARFAYPKGTTQAFPQTSHLPDEEEGFFDDELPRVVEHGTEPAPSSPRRRPRKGSVELWVGGRSGLGKAALLDEFVAGLPRDVLVLHGRCHEHESLPYKVFDSVVDARPVPF